MAKRLLPPEVLEYFRKQGAKGGRKAAQSMTAEQRIARSQAANNALTPEQRVERSKKAVAAREKLRKQRS